MVFSSVSRIGISSLEAGDSVYDETVDDRGTSRSGPLSRGRLGFNSILCHAKPYRAEKCRSVSVFEECRNDF